MRQAILPSAKLVPFLEQLRRDATLVAPVVAEGGPILAEVSSAEQAAGAAAVLAAADGGNTRLSLKGTFFPQREVLFSFAAGSLEEVPGTGSGNAPPLVVFGARPCDARAMTMLDKVFGGGGREDPYFTGRRRCTVVIAMACDAPAATCFCTSVGGSPYGTDGVDLLASAAGSGLLLEAGSDRGEELLARQAGLLSESAGGDLAARAQRAEAAAARLEVLDFSGIKERLDESYGSPVWQSVTRRCLGCGACTWLCPTCHCFDVTDETRGPRGVRVRTWDTCQASLFTQHASGHNPRPDRRARMRQRLMHKYTYAVETAGETFCSGCGRCVRSCPVNLDIREMLAAIRQVQP